MAATQLYGDEWERGERLDFWNWPRRWEGVGNPKKECMKLPGELPVHLSGGVSGHGIVTNSTANPGPPRPAPFYTANEAWRYSGPAD